MENINPKCDRCPHEDTLICDTCEDNGKDMTAEKLKVILKKEEETAQNEDLYSRPDNRSI